MLSLIHYVTDIEALMTAGDIRRQFFAAPYSVTTIVQVVRLYHPDLLVEITATAETPRDRFRAPAAVSGEQHSELGQAMVLIIYRSVYMIKDLMRSVFVQANVAAP